MMSDQEYVLKESGLFWWQNVEAGDYSNETSVAGELSIQADGYVVLDLHGMLNDQDAIIDGVFAQKRALPESKAIFGILRGGVGCVLIWKLHSNGAHAALTEGGFSHQAFGAYRCLLGNENIKTITTGIELFSFEIKLIGLEAWWKEGLSPHIEKNENEFSITYRKRKSVSHPILGGNINIHFGLDYKKNPPPKASFFAEEWAGLVFEYSESNSFDALINKYEKVQDLMTILLNHPHTLDWPILSVGRLYFKRSKPVESNINNFNCWTHFNWLEENFGEILDNWYGLHEKYGPSIQLFLSTKRHIPGVLETHFNNLVFSIESLHRSEFGSVNPEGKLRQL